MLGTNRPNCRGGRQWEGIFAMRRLAPVLTSFVLALGLAGVSSEAQAKTVPPPNSIAAIGDSISQAANSYLLGNHPENSWSTGGASWDGVTSHYEHILAFNPDIAGRNYNDSVSGARMSGANAQAERAVSQKARYVTILMGGNDVCTSNNTNMTPVDTFRTQFDVTLQTLFAGLPRNAHVFVASIPNIYQLWEVLHTNPTAAFIWDAFNICQSM